jgi:predicted nucleotidyltransferase
VVGTDVLGDNVIVCVACEIDDLRVTTDGQSEGERAMGTQVELVVPDLDRIVPDSPASRLIARCFLLPDARPPSRSPVPIRDDSAILAVADLPGTRGIALAGSVARGEQTEWSDIDVLRYVEGTGVANAVPPRWVGDRLVRVSCYTMEEAWAELDRPELAIWAILPLREMRILVDRDGEVARLQRAARSFDWGSMAERAIAWASRRLAKDAENVLKLRAAIDARDESSILNAHLNLAQHCADAVAVARGVLIPTENRFHDVVRAAAGSDWTRLQRAAYGLDSGDAVARARATCELYAATVALLASELDDEDRLVAERAIRVTAE